jgi:hypothetical protein
MATDMTPTTIDLTGLPESVIREVTQLVEEARRKQAAEAAGKRPPLMGRFAHLGLSFPKEVIDEAQRECWANFPREFPDTPRR